MSVNKISFTEGVPDLKKSIFAGIVALFVATSSPAFASIEYPFENHIFMELAVQYDQAQTPNVDFFSFPQKAICRTYASWEESSRHRDHSYYFDHNATRTSFQFKKNGTGISASRTDFEPEFGISNRSYEFLSDISTHSLSTHIDESNKKLYMRLTSANKVIIKEVFVHADGRSDPLETFMYDLCIIQ